MSADNSGLKRCSKCGCTILLKYFSENRKGELFKTCDKCREKGRKYDVKKKDARKIYYSNHKEHMNNQSKIYAENHKDEIKEQNKKYYENNKEKLNTQSRIYAKNHKEEIYKSKKLYYLNNKEKIKSYNDNNKEYFKQQGKIYKDNNKEKIRIYERNRLKTDINYRVLKNLRCRLWSAVKNNVKSAPTKELLGCTSEELKIHLENKFTDGMNWDNYGEWHIDHIIPCCSFDMSSSDKQKECFHFSNLQPLWALDNMIKGGRILLEEGDILDEIRIMPYI
jgi:hypothetical protein